MSAIVSTQISSLGTVLTNGEYTVSEVQADYAALIKPIIDAFNRGRMVLTVNKSQPDGALSPADPNLSGSLSTTDVAAVKTALANLLLLAQNGKVVGGKTYYLSLDMANGVDQVKKSLDAAGFNPALSDSDNLAALSRLQDLANIGIDQLILGAGDAVFSNKSIQSLIELEYVKTGNEVIGGNLESLKTALEATKTVIDALNAVQDLKNKIVPGTVNTSASDAFVAAQDPSAASNTATNNSFGTIDEFSKAWNQIADQTFGYLAPTIDPTIQKNPDDHVDKWKVTDATVTLFFQLREKITLALAKLKDINGGEPFAEGSVGANLQKVLDDMTINLAQTEGNPVYVLFGGKSTPGVYTLDAPADSIVLDAQTLRNKLGDVKYNEFLQRGFLSATLYTVDSYHYQIGSSTFNSSNPTYTGGDFPNIGTPGQVYQPVSVNYNTSGPATRIVVPKTIAVDTSRAIALWITDKQEIGNETESGNIQRTLTEAITSSENLNDTQKEDMRRFMFVFEEFYKSASSMLQTITQMIQRMAQGIKQ